MIGSSNINALRAHCSSFISLLSHALERYLFYFKLIPFFSGYFDSAIKGTTFLPTSCHFVAQISYPFDFINWRNLLVKSYGKCRPVDVIFDQAQSQSSRYLICVILRQTHFVQVQLVRNIASHTLKGLIREGQKEIAICKRELIILG